jgi:hypothetical protein
MTSITERGGAVGDSLPLARNTKLPARVLAVCIQKATHVPVENGNAQAGMLKESSHANERADRSAA